MKVTDVLNLGDGVTDKNDPHYDVLAVVAEDDEGNPIECVNGPDGKPYAALGWYSATTDHFPDSAYSTDERGELVRDESVKPKAMTKAQVTAYAEGLVTDQCPAIPTLGPKPVPVAFS